MVPAEAALVRPPARLPGGMEPEPRRRRRRHSCRPLVSVFLRDPSSGRVYRRGKLIGKVGTPAPPVRWRGGRAGQGSRRGGARARDRNRKRASVRPDFCLCVCRVSTRVWGWRGWTPGSAMYPLFCVHRVAGTGVGHVVLCCGLCV